MSENKNPGFREFADDAKAALERLRSYAAGHSNDLNNAIDRLGDFIDKSTGGRFAGQVDKAQDFARRQVGNLGDPALDHPPTANDPDPFALDDEPTAAPQTGDAGWKQPPGQAQKAFADTAQNAKVELQAAVERLRTFAGEHKENLSGLVDRVGDFVDAQTGGKYADRIDRIQASAKSQLDKHLTKPAGAPEPPTDPSGPANPA